MNLEPIKARLAAATPGPWGQGMAGDKPLPEVDYSAAFGFITINERSDDGAGGVADADFIAHAPTDLADLVAEVERLQAVVLSQDDMDLPGMWSYSDFTGGDPDDRSYSQREKDASRIAGFVAEVERLQAVVETSHYERATDHCTCCDYYGQETQEDDG